MEYVYNDDGEVKVRTQNGTPKWLPKRLAEDAMLMRTMHLTIVEAPIKFCEEFKLNTPIKEDIETQLEIEEETNTAEVTPAKRGRKPNIK